MILVEHNETYDSSSLIPERAIKEKHHEIYDSSSVLLAGVVGEYHEMYNSSSLIIEEAVGETAEDYLTEREALSDGPITDFREAVSVENSSIQLLSEICFLS